MTAVYVISILYLYTEMKDFIKYYRWKYCCRSTFGL